LVYYIKYEKVPVVVLTAGTFFVTMNNALLWYGVHSICTHIDNVIN